MVNTNVLNKQKTRKFRKGNRITDIAYLCKLIAEGRWIYLRDTPKHPSVINCMTLNTVNSLLTYKYGFFEAIVNE